MDKITARNSIANAGVSTRDIAHSIYLATVRGVSGANQNDGMGFLLSAVAELWNIRGAIGNPNAKTKITGRYRGMNVTEQMILNVISQYPNGFNGYQPSFDELFGIGVSRTNKNCQSAYDDFENYYNTSKGVVTTQPATEQPKIKVVEGSYEDGFGVGYGELYSNLDDEDDYDEDEVQPQQSSCYSDEEVRDTAELIVIMAIQLAQAMSNDNKDYSNMQETLIDYVVSRIRELGL